jgi:hypothetical protein
MEYESYSDIHRNNDSFKVESISEHLASNSSESSYEHLSSSSFNKEVIDSFMYEEGIDKEVIDNSMNEGM